MRIGTYFASSALAAIVVIWHAFATREQYVHLGQNAFSIAHFLTHLISFLSFVCDRFFPSMVYLTNSKLSVAILGNFGFASALGVYKFLTWVRFYLIQRRRYLLASMSTHTSFFFFVFSFFAFAGVPRETP